MPISVRLPWVAPTPTAPQGGDASWPSSLSRSAIAKCAFVFACALILATAALAEPTFPPLTGRIVDEAGLLSSDDKRALEGELKALEEKSTDQLVIFTARSLQGYPIEDFGYRLGR